MTFASVLYIYIVVGEPVGAISCVGAHMSGRKLTPRYCTMAIFIAKTFSVVGMSSDSIFPICSSRMVCGLWLMFTPLKVSGLDDSIALGFVLKRVSEASSSVMISLSASISELSTCSSMTPHMSSVSLRYSTYGSLVALVIPSLSV